MQRISCIPSLDSIRFQQYLCTIPTIATHCAISIYTFHSDHLDLIPVTNRSALSVADHKNSHFYRPQSQILYHNQPRISSYPSYLRLQYSIYAHMTTAVLYEHQSNSYVTSLVHHPWRTPNIPDIYTHVQHMQIPKFPLTILLNRCTTVLNG